MIGTKINRVIEGRLEIYQDMVLEINDRIENNVEGSFNSLLNGEDLDFLYELKDSMDSLWCINPKDLNEIVDRDNHLIFLDAVQQAMMLVYDGGQLYEEYYYHLEDMANNHQQENLID